MPLSLKETRAVSGLVEVLYGFLPGSGHAIWKGHVNFGTVASKVGLANFWPGGSKKPAINTLLSQTLEHRRSLFQPLILEIVRSAIGYREKQSNPITVAEIDALNGHILEIGFKFPDLWDKGFRDSLRQTTAERAEQGLRFAQDQQQEMSGRMQRSEELRRLKEAFIDLTSESDRQKAGLKLEVLLNQLFTIYGLDPRRPFKITGEQIDGSFDLDAQIYLVEAKWEKEPLPEAPMLIFRGKIEGKSTFTRGVFIAMNGVSNEARHAITQGKSPSFFVMDGYDLFMILSETINLTDFLRKRIRLLAEEGRVCVPLTEIQ
jgi:Restriction endonuclease